jgi:hypothetical protein
MMNDQWWRLNVSQIRLSLFVIELLLVSANIALWILVLR